MASAHSPGARPEVATRGAQFSQGDLNRLVSRAVAAERVRVAQIFNNHASRGRERLSATLLTDPRGLSAEDIAAKLSFSPTDREAELERAAHTAPQET